MKISNNKKYLTKSLEHSGMFANIATSLHSRGERTRQILTGIFYALLIYGFVTPCIVVMAILPLLGEGQREVRDRFLFPARETNSFEMSKLAEKNLNEVNNSTLASLQQSYNQLKEDFKRKYEANARACYFIISMGLAKEYSEFILQNNDYKGWYNACLFKLGLDSQTNKSKLS